MEQIDFKNPNRPRNPDLNPPIVKPPSPERPLEVPQGPSIPGTPDTFPNSQPPIINQEFK